MTYKTHPTYGVKETVFGAAAYANAQFIQKASKNAAQSASIGESKDKPIIEGFEDIVYKMNGTNETSLGAAAYVDAQTLQAWASNLSAN